MILTLLLLILARTENATLKAKVKELTEQVKVLTVDNAALLAEVEIYRKEAALPTFSKLALGQAPLMTTTWISQAITCPATTLFVLEME